MVQLSFKLGEPSNFTGGKKDGRSWLSQLMRHFRAIGLNMALHEDNEQMCTIALSLMRGPAAKWVTKLEQLDELPTTI